MAVDRLEQLYSEAASTLTAALDSFLTQRKPPSAQVRARCCYPLLRVIHRENGGPWQTSFRAFAKLQQPGVYETTITHPGPFRSYLLEQLGPRVSEYGAAAFPHAPSLGCWR
jgi:AMP nucleosidase